MKLQLAEPLFKTIMGESTWAGLPGIIVRAAGCNQRCSYCDSKFAYESQLELDVQEVYEQVAVSGQKLVLITGGEPLLQMEGVLELTNTLLYRKKDGYQVLIETNGTIDVKLLLRTHAHLIMDVKCPSSTLETTNFPLDATHISGKVCYDNLDRLHGYAHNVKFVVGEGIDFMWAKDVIRRYALVKKHVPLLMSPVYGKLAPFQLAQWILDSGLPIRLNLQLHKIIWGPKTRK